jgi:hypothetical protein
MSKQSMTGNDSAMTLLPGSAKPWWPSVIGSPSSGLQLSLLTANHPCRTFKLLPNSKLTRKIFHAFFFKILCDSQMKKLSHLPFSKLSQDHQRHQLLG